MASLSRLAPIKGMLYKTNVFKTFQKHGKSELAPPSISDFMLARNQIQGMIKKTLNLKFLDLKVKDAVANLLVVVEITGIFYLGEIIGRGGSITGYDSIENHIGAHH